MLVPIDADPEIDLPGARIGLKGFAESEDRVGRGGFNAFEHSRFLEDLSVMDALVRVCRLARRERSQISLRAIC